MTVRNADFVKQFSREWHIAHNKLIQNVKEQPFVSEYECSAYATLGGQKVYLPAYIPYIGPNYFEYRPRVLCYAINQNLSPHVPWTEDWVTQWGKEMKIAYDRLNCAAQAGLSIPIRPYAEGFIPLVALIAIRRWIETKSGSLPQTIDDVVAVTNFIKFSTAKDASSSSIPNSWWKECSSLYVGYEIQVLQPDIIVGFGQKTVAELTLLLRNREVSCAPELLGCRFPARIASIKSRPLLTEESKVWNGKIFPLVDRMREPKQNSYHRWKVENFAGYFVDVVASWS